MKFSPLLFALTLSMIGYGQKIIKIEGTYQGKDLYLQNSKCESSKHGFCVDSVIVNSIKWPCKIDSNIIVVEFDAILGEPPQIDSELIIEIHHQDDCSPTVLSTYQKPIPTPHLEKFEINLDSNLSFTLDEKVEGTVYIEQFKWHKWIQVSDAIAFERSLDTTIDLNPYLHSGKNKFRIGFKTIKGLKKSYKNLEFNSNKTEETFIYSKKNQTIQFNGNLSFEIYDSYGKLLDKGTTKKIDVSSYPKGKYYLNYGNKSGEFRIKNK